MESIPLIVKSRVTPNLDVTSLIREIFQSEFEVSVPSKKLSENLRKSLEYEKIREDVDGERSYRSVCFLDNLPNEKGKLMTYAENVFEAYTKHEEALNRIAKVELNVMETQAMYLRREEAIGRDQLFRDLLRLKRHPLMKPFEPDHVKRFSLLQGESGLPPKHEARVDFKIKDYQKWKKRLSNASQDTLANFVDKTLQRGHNEPMKKRERDDVVKKKRRLERPKKTRTKDVQPRQAQVFRSDPPVVYFTEYTPGEVYQSRVTVKNVHTKPIRFVVKPLRPDSPFRVELCGITSMRILPGLSFKILVTFEPQSINDESDDLILLLEDESRMVIPLTSCLEPPVLKTHKHLDEFTKDISARIKSSYIDCGGCFPGDSKVTKIRFYSIGGSGEFFMMSSDNWSNYHIDSLTTDNFTDLPPFRFYPTYFRIDRNQVVDLYVEFKPPHSGLHSENVIIVCDNGEIRYLDILGDGVSWHRSFISFEGSMEKNFAPYIADDHRALYWLDLDASLSTGKLEKSFCLANKSTMPFEFRWEMRDAVIGFGGGDRIGKLTPSEVRVEPTSGTFLPGTKRIFNLSVTFDKKPVGSYRTVLSFYVTGLPYQCIEQATTVIRPSGRFKSVSLFGEDTSPQPSYAYESVRDGIKTTDICRKHQSFCGIPLRRSRTMSNLGDSIEACTETQHSKNNERNLTELGSDLLWDFVDVLVDEVEVWAEVKPPIVNIEPIIVNLYTDVRLKQTPVKHDVFVRNSNTVPITCQWLKIKKQDVSCDGSEGEDSDTDYYQVTCYAKQRCSVKSIRVADAVANKYVDIRIDPSGSFVVPAMERVKCTLTVSAAQPGVINRIAYLAVENVSLLELYIVGKIPDRDLTVLPRMLDFGSKKRGTRYTKYFKIKNDNSDPIEWKVEQYRFDFDKKTLVGPVDEERQSNLKRVRGILDSRDCTIESYKLDARKEGLQTTVLKFDLAYPSVYPTRSRYILVAGDVQTPKLAIEGPRFSNAILAPGRPMYIGRHVIHRVTLRNMKPVPTSFIWGNPFGCHSRKVCLCMSPRYAIVPGLKKVVVEIRIIPLEEGIVEHCYVPCFFSRTVNPVLLSVVGIVKSVSVTIDLSPDSDASSTVITWPINDLYHRLGISHLPESQILDFVCHCGEIEAERTRMAMTDEADGEEIPCFDRDHNVEEDDDLYWKRATPLEQPLTRRTLDDGGEDSQTLAEVQKDCVDILNYVSSEIQFLNVLHKTVAVKTFTIRNESPISTNFRLRVKYFAKVEDRDKKSKIAEVRDRVTGHVKGEIESGLICGQPLLIALSPSEGVLEGWASIHVKVSVYGNTWGEYRDFIMCEITGIPTFVMRVFVQLSGHPIQLPMFRTCRMEIPILRFDTVRYKSEPVVKSIRVRNTSSIPITVTWMVFLTSPIAEENREEPFNICLDFYTEKGSDKGTKSSQNYLSKNTSGTVPLIDMDMDKMSSQWGMDPTSEMDSLQKDSPDRVRSFKAVTSSPPTTREDLTKPEIQLLENYGKLDLHLFQIHPRELDIDAYADEKISIVFNTNLCTPSDLQQEYEAVVTGCVRLTPDHSDYPDIYHRPCGKDYVSKLFNISAAVERPILRFDFFESDLVYVVNVNDVIKEKSHRRTKKYLVQNKGDTSVTVSVFVDPGEVFKVERVETLRKIYDRFDEEHHRVTVDPGTVAEVHVEVSLTLQYVRDVYKKLGYTSRCGCGAVTVSSDIITERRIVVDGGDPEDDNAERAPALPCCDEASESSGFPSFDIRPVDSSIATEKRTRLWKSADEGRTVPFRTAPCHSDDDTCPGEDMDVAEDTTTVRDIVDLYHVIRETLVFDQVGLLKQVVSPELHLVFPSIRISPEVVDFGNVVVGETGTCYASIINQSQFPIDFKITRSSTRSEFSVRPASGHLFAADPKLEIGRQISIRFAPRQPGYFKTTFRIYGNAEKEFNYFTLTAFGFGTWNEKYKYYPRAQPCVKLPIITLPNKK